MSTWCRSENGITLFIPYTDDDDAYTIGIELLTACTASSMVTKHLTLAST